MSLWITDNEIARLLGCTRQNAHLQSQAGKFGERRKVNRDGTPGSPYRVSLAKVESVLDRDFTPAQIAALDKQTDQHEFPIPDPGILSAVIESRDLMWRRHLIAHDIHNVEPLPPPLDPAGECFDAQRVFTRDQAIGIAERALARRDASWKIYNDDVIRQGLRPDGPAPVILT